MRFSKGRAEKLAKELKYKGDMKEFYAGLQVELEHGTVSPATNITNDDPILTAKIALAHLAELPMYYTLLKEMEEKGEAMLKAKNIRYGRIN